MRNLKIGGMLAFALVVFASVLFGQIATGGVNGTLTDTSGAVIPGANVTLTNEGTKITATAETNAAGFYTFVNVAPGPYTLKATKSGFKTATVSAFEVNVNHIVTQDITLSVGKVTQSVEVTGAAPLLQSSTSNLGTVIGVEAIQQLPMNGRNFTQMTLLTPGVTPVNTAQEWGSTVKLPGSTWVKPSVDGQWNRSDAFMMDGIINLEGETSGYSILPSLDAVQEFKVQTHNDKAEFGLVMGGTVNLVSKSGTNQLHGSLFEFVRNELFDARNPFTDIVPVDEQNPALGLQGPAKFRQNQFGATVGGPVYIPHLYNGRDKTFFFFSYDAWRYRLANSSLYRMPTASELTGDFTDWPGGVPIYNPYSTRSDPNNSGSFLRDPFMCDSAGNPLPADSSGLQAAGTPCNKIPSSLLSPTMVKTLKNNFLYDQPNISLGYNNVINNRPIVNDENGFQARIDHQVSPKANLFVRYNYMKVTADYPDTLHNGGQDVQTPQQIGVGWNQILKPTMVLSSRFAFTTVPWVRSPEHPLTAAEWSALGWNQINAAGGQVNVGIDGIDAFGIEGDPESLVSQHQYQLSQDLSLVKGNHQFKFGYLMFRQSWGGTNPYIGADFAVDTTADPSQTGGVVSGIGLASALLGLPVDSFRNAEAYGQYYYTWGFYGQDEWRITPRLTLNYGLRWEFYNPPTYTSYTAGNFDINSGNYWIGGTQLPGLCSQVGAAPCIPGTGLASLPGGNHIQLAPYPNISVPYRKNFEPRIGVAWRFAPKTVLRAGADMVSDVYSGLTQQNNNITAAWPNSNFAGAEYNLLGEPITNIGTVQGAAITAFPDDTPWYTIFGFDPYKKPPYSIQYNTQFQHEFTKTLTGSIAYSGSITRRLDYGYELNAAVTPGPGSAADVNARRLFPYIPTSFGYSTGVGSASYNSLQAEINRRFAGGAMLLAAYTWSKSMDNGSSGWFGSENGPSGRTAIQNSYDRNSNRSVSAYDVTHNFWVSGIYYLPVGKGKRWLSGGGPLSWVLGDWRTDIIQSMRSGQPWNPRVAGDLANIGVGSTYLRPNLVGNPNVANPTAAMWINPAAFGLPQFAYGNLGRNTFRSKAVFDTDFSIEKVFNIGEKAALHFRAESFNLFNVMNYGVPAALVGQSDFGVIESLAGQQYPRQFQFGLRLTF